MAEGTIYMICVYDIGNENFGQNGDAVLTPLSGSVHNVAGGNYDLQMVHPIDPDGKWKHLVPGAIVKVPVPEEVIENSFSGYDADIYKTTAEAELREDAVAPTSITYPEWNGSQMSPTDYSVGDKVSVTGAGHRNYQCVYFDTSSQIRYVQPYNSSWWKEIPDSTTGAPVLVTLPAGTELYFVEDVDTTWYKMSTYYGLEGYIQKSKVTFDRHVSASENQPRVITEQLFRLKEPNIDNDAQTVTVTGQHVSYDLNGDLVQNVSISQASPAMALGRIMEGLMIPYRGNIATNLTTDDNGTYTGEIKGKNGMYALLDPDKGIVSSFNARFTRDNWDLFVMQRTSVDRGYRIRYGVNARGIQWKRSSTNLVNRIVPVAKAEGGEDLYLPEKWVDSPLISSYPVIIMERLSVAGQVGKDKGTGDGSTWTASDLYDEMRAKAAERFSVQQADKIAEEVTIQIEPLENTVEYAWLKGLTSVLLYDTVIAYDERIGLEMTLYVSELEYDFVKKKIAGLKLSNTQDFGGRTVTGYNVQNNSIGSEKLTDGAKAELIQAAVDVMPEYADPNAARPSSDISVIDNLTSTSATDALSANQGRVLNTREEVTLAVYGSRVENISSTEKTNAYKAGKVIVINGACNVLANLTSAQTTLFTIPQDFRPSDYVFFIAKLKKSGSDTYCNAEINTTNGNINFTHGGLSAGDTVRFQCVYTIA